MNWVIRKIVLLVVGLFASVNIVAADPEWTFVWISSGQGGYEVNKGSAVVKIVSGKVEISASGKQGVSFRFIGKIDKGKIIGKLTIIDSDFFKDSPFAGTHSKKRWPGVAGSSGRESIVLTDGWNGVCLTREIK